MLATQNVLAGEINLSGLRMSKLPGLHWFALVKNLDLSQNQLAEVQGFHSMPLLESLNLSSNRIRNLHGLGGLNYLEKLSVDQNGRGRCSIGRLFIPFLVSSGSYCPLSSPLLNADLKDVHCLSDLRRLPSLQSFSMKGNAACERDGDLIKRFVRAEAAWIENLEM
jgi:hypothetical protein